MIENLARSQSWCSLPPPRTPGLYDTTVAVINCIIS